MPIFDVSQDWVILIPPEIPAAQRGGDELSLAIGMLRRQSRVGMDPPAVEDASRFPSGNSAPLIVLNAKPDQGKLNEFSWRLGRDRLEIYGASGRGLCKGIFDFLAALGLRWPRPGEERALYRAKTGTPPILPVPDRVRPWEYSLGEIKNHRPTEGAPEKRRRLFLAPGLSPRDGEKWIAWAARNTIDGVVFPLPEPGGSFLRPSGRRRSFPNSLLALAESYALTIETGGWDLSLLLPRRYFFPNPELFRMEQGKRIKQIHFCATNPDTLGILKQEAEAVLRACPEIEVFHLWPERGNEQTWCACPSCRAFSPGEQNRMVVNYLADRLGALKPSLWVSYGETTGEQIDIPPGPICSKWTPSPAGTGRKGRESFGRDAKARGAARQPVTLCGPLHIHSFV